MTARQILVILGSVLLFVGVFMPTSLSAPVDKWQGGEGKRSAMDDSPTVVFSLKAENEIQGWLAKRTPTLIVRCLERNRCICCHRDGRESRIRPLSGTHRADTLRRR